MHARKHPLHSCVRLNHTQSRDTLQHAESQQLRLYHTQSRSCVRLYHTQSAAV